LLTFQFMGMVLEELIYWWYIIFNLQVYISCVSLVSVVWRCFVYNLHFRIKMPPKYDNVVDLNPLKKNMQIKVRVIRLWKMPAYNNPSEFFSLEMVLCDKSVSSFSCPMFPNLFCKFIVSVIWKRAYCSVVFLSGWPYSWLCKKVFFAKVQQTIGWGQGLFDFQVSSWSKWRILQDLHALL